MDVQLVFGLVPGHALRAFEYFERAWGQVVLPRLRYRFERGPIDWDQRPEPGAAVV